MPNRGATQRGNRLPASFTRYTDHLPPTYYATGKAGHGLQYRVRYQPVELTAEITHNVFGHILHAVFLQQNN